MKTRTCTITHRAAAAMQMAALLAALGFIGSTPTTAGEWKWSLTPYVWATDVGVDVSLDDRQVVSKTLRFSDLLDGIDAAAQGHVEALHGAHGLMFDVFEVELSEDDSRFDLPMPPGASARLDSKVGMTIVEAAGIFDPHGDQKGFSFLYGTRLLWQRNTLDARFDMGPVTTTREYESDDRYVDALAGVRFSQSLSRRWGYLVRADASTGGTKLTWSGGAAVGYTFGPNGRYTATAGYRYMSVNYDDTEPLDTEMTLSGIFTGLRFSF
ncbi:MAG TPA: hypothetical protein VNI57_03650 [Candidatus Saccharimonadales bacterium]|nr:hypothetical protein [Candidatus Saccharimonadales bacterium]